MKLACKLALFFLVVAYAGGHAQPVASSKQIIDGLEVYGDLQDENIFYYAPGSLELSLNANDKPDFQLLELRYTGSSAYGDNGDTRFLNVVQFGVSMKQASAASLRAMRERLGSGPADLRPLPLREIDAFLVVPVGQGGDKGAYKKIGRDGTFQAETDAGVSGKGGFWTERTFTLKLENHEAQLLWDQVANGQLSMTLSYTFYADMVQGLTSEMNISRDGRHVEGLPNPNEQPDSSSTMVLTQPVKTDAFPIRVNVSRWPDLLRKIDINEGVPPGYAALEVRCFDFANDLRPDLAVKGIEISAVGVGGRTVTIPTQMFLRSEPDLYAKHIRFPYAVKLTEPYRYRIIEYTAEGEKNVSSWQTVKEWSAHLDITTPTKENSFIKKELEIELPMDEFNDRQVKEAKVRIDFSLGAKMQHQVITYHSGDSLSIKQVTFKCDRDRPITFYVDWTFADETSMLTESSPVPGDNYLYLTVPEQ